MTPARTVTEADIVNFAGLSGDFNAIHTDEVFCLQLGLPGRIAHGLLTISILSGLSERVGYTEGTILAFLGMNNLSYGKYVTPGDTIHGDAVLECETVLMIRRRAEPCTT